MKKSEYKQESRVLLEVIANRESMGDILGMLSEVCWNKSKVISDDNLSNQLRLVGMLLDQTQTTLKIMQEKQGGI